MVNDAGRFLTGVSVARSVYTEPAPMEARAPEPTSALDRTRGLGFTVDKRGSMWVLEQWMSSESLRASEEPYPPDPPEADVMSPAYCPPAAAPSRRAGLLCTYIRPSESRDLTRIAARGPPSAHDRGSLSPSVRSRTIRRVS